MLIFFMIFLQFLLIFGGKGRGLSEKVNSAIDRARRVLFGTIIGPIGTNSQANPFKKYQNFDAVQAVFCILGRKESTFREK